MEGDDVGDRASAEVRSHCSTSANFASPDAYATIALAGLVLPMLTRWLSERCNVCSWPEADMLTEGADVRYRVYSGLVLLAVSLSASDPNRTSPRLLLVRLRFECGRFGSGSPAGMPVTS